MPSSRLKNWKTIPTWRRRMPRELVLAHPGHEHARRARSRRRRGVEPGDEVQQRRLAAARRTHEPSTPRTPPLPREGPPHGGLYRCAVGLERLTRSRLVDSTSCMVTLLFKPVGPAVLQISTPWRQLSRVLARCRHPCCHTPAGEGPHTWSPDWRSARPDVACPQAKRTGTGRVPVTKEITMKRTSEQARGDGNRRGRGGPGHGRRRAALGRIRRPSERIHLRKGLQPQLRQRRFCVRRVPSTGVAPVSTPPTHVTVSQHGFAWGDALAGAGAQARR